MMSIEFQDGLAARMRAEHATLAARWFERLRDLLPVDARDVFPTASLLDHIPALIVEFVYQPPFWLHAVLWGPLILLATRATLGSAGRRTMPAT